MDHHIAAAEQLRRIHVASHAWGDEANARYQSGDEITVRRVRDLIGMLQEQTAEIQRLRAKLKEKE